MSWHLLHRASTVSGVLAGLGLFASAAIAQETPQSVTEIDGFLNWLSHPDAGEPPNGPRPGDNFCLVTLGSAGENSIWSDRPTFIIQGSPRSLAIYQDVTAAPIWEHPVNDAEVVAYTGPPLEPDTVYTFRARHPRFESTIYEQRELRTMSFDDEVQTTANLISLEGEMRNGGPVTETEIAIARADYFWQQGLETDAWATLWPLQAESSEVAEAISISTDRLCNLAPDFGTNLE
ncbi:MAG: hypothetical protein ACFB0G_01875 [Leptolyngbyaceae cyanobacterium]